MSLGGSKSKQKSSSESSGFGFGFNSGQTYLDPAQQAQQQRLAGQFFGTDFNQGLGVNQYATGIQQMDAMRNAAGLRDISGYGAAQGQGALAQFAQQQNPYLQNQIQGLAQDYGQILNEQILPGIGNEAQAMGQRGSSRQGIAEALGAERVLSQFGQDATNLRADAYAQQQQAATDLMRQGQAGNIAGQQLYGQGIGQGVNNYLSYQQAQMNPFMIGSQVIGDPSILSRNFGMDYREQKTKSQGSGGSSGLNLGFI